MTRFIETHRERFGVEPIGRELQVAPQAYYAARRCPRSARRIRDEALQVKLRQVHAEHFGVYGARKLWRQLTREGILVDRGVQYLSIRYTERLAEVGAVSSVGSRGDSYDNALAESVNGLYKAELVHRRGPWRGLEDLELATLEWVDWFNHRRLSSAIGYVPPAEYEASQYCESVPAPAATQ